MARTPATIPADFGRPSTERATPQDTHAFDAREKEATGTIVVHFKVLLGSADERYAVARVIEAQLKGQRVGSRDLSVVITGGDEADSALVDLGPLEARITANVMQRLGIR